MANKTLSLSSYDIHRANVLLLGQTGTGKSTFIETLKNRQYQPKTRVLNSRTQEATLNHLGFQIGPEHYDLTIIDTPGLADNTGKANVAIKSLISKFVKSGVTSLNMVLLAVPMDRVIDSKHVETLNSLLCFLGPSMRKITYLLGTHAEGKTDDEKLKWARGLLNSPMSTLVNFVQGKLVFSGMVGQNLASETREKFLNGLKDNQEKFLKKAVSQEPIKLVMQQDDSVHVHQRFEMYEATSRNCILMDAVLPRFLEENVKFRRLWEKLESVKENEMSEEMKEKITEALARFQPLSEEEARDRHQRIEREFNQNLREYELLGNAIKQAADEVSKMHELLQKLSIEGMTLVNEVKLLDDPDESFELEI